MLKMVWKLNKSKRLTIIKDLIYRFWWMLKMSLKPHRTKWVILKQAVFDDEQQIDDALLPMLCPLLRADGPLYVMDYLGFHCAVKYSHLFFLDAPAILSNRTIRKVIRAAESFVRAERNEENKPYLRRCQRLLGAAAAELGNPKCIKAINHLEKALDLIKEYPSIRKDYPELPYYFFKCLGTAINSLLGLSKD